jgi:tetratricopeptide (TPR) repeat protein
MGETAASALRSLQRAGRHDEAVREAKRLLREQPGERDLLLALALSLRYLGRIAEALEVLGELETLHPKFSRLHQERGLCYVALKDAAKAIPALLVSVNINPALPTSWKLLEGLYRLTGDEESARTAAAHVATLKGLPGEVVASTALYADGDLIAAEAVIRNFLIRQGDHPEALRLLAKIAAAQDVLNDAERLLRGVLDQAPGHRAARRELAEVLVKRHKHAEAREEVEALLALDPANLDYRTQAATIAVGLGEHDRALSIYAGMLKDAPQSWDIPLWMGHVLKTVGRLPEAIQSYRAAAKARPDFGDAYWSLANLKTYRFAPDEIEAMRSGHAAASTDAEDRAHLAFALGKALEDQGAYEEAWRFYEQGNQIRCAESRYRPEIIETNTRKQIELMTPAVFEHRQGWGTQAPDPIFVVGLPRSGSTLIEQILASHSMIEGTQELSNIPRIVLELHGRDPDLDDPRYPASVLDLDAPAIRAFGERYIEETRAYRTGRAFFIDKMPNNFRHIGLIHLILPNAKIIDARREPMACCQSNLKQLFANGQEFSYSVEHIGRYYRTYLELMRHWDGVLPGRVLRVQHEDLVEDLEGGVRRILDYCGLPFEEACLEFYKTRRSVRTPSSEQVRQPIFRDGLDQWRHFEPFLGPLKTVLGDALTAYRQ